jgi:histidyl-tRNA synthetase
VANKAKFQAIKGTRDLLPPETELWNRVEATAREVFGTFGYGEIRPPIFEPTELFARAIGQETDVVSKEMYSFEDHDFAEIEKLRVLILTHSEFVFAEQAEHLVGLIKNFAEGVSTLLEKSRIPKTEENFVSVRGLKGVLNAFEDEIKQQVRRPEKEKDDTYFAPNIEYIQNTVRKIRLGDVVTLRPEATASICRAYIEHNMNQLPAPVKLYCIGPMFRRERPQKGRYRQFYQIDAEVLGGSDAPGIDAEVIEMVMTLFARLELDSVQLEINSIGHSAPSVDGKAVCRRAYVEKLRAALLEVKDKLGEDSRRRIETNPLRVLDSKLEHEQAIIATLPRIADHLCDDCAKHYAEVKRQLDVRGVKYHENWRLVRGLDYYMRTTFEITAKGLGSQNAVCGGGRYDGLVELLGGPPTKGIGFAIGEDRLILSLQEAGKAGTAQGRDVFIAWMGGNAQTTAIAAAQKLRAAGLRVELPPSEQKFGKALGQADKLGAKYALILGDDEIASGEWTLKSLADGTQTKIAEAKLLEFLKEKRA